jgi:hypothetical protein
MARIATSAAKHRNPQKRAVRGTIRLQDIRLRFTLAESQSRSHEQNTPKATLNRSIADQLPTTDRRHWRTARGGAARLSPCGEFAHDGNVLGGGAADRGI